MCSSSASSNAKRNANGASWSANSSKPREDHRLRPRRWRRARCRRGRHAPGAARTGHQARPGGRHLDRRGQRRRGGGRSHRERHRSNWPRCGRRRRRRRSTATRTPASSAASRAAPTCTRRRRCGASSTAPSARTRRSRTSRSRSSAAPPASSGPPSTGSPRARWSQAVLASSAVPGLLPPVPVDGEHYIDGGVVNSIPVGRAVELGADHDLGAAGGPGRPAAAAAEAAPRRRAGRVRDRPPAPVRPRDGRAAGRGARRTCCPRAAARRRTTPRCRTAT